MSPRELVHRLFEQTRRSVSRRDGRGWVRFERGDGPLVPLPALAALATTPWPAGLAQAAFPDGAPPSFLGQPWPVGVFARPEAGFWHTDPVTGAQWPGADSFCFDVRWRQVADKSDVKFVLELNRLQHLQAPCAHAAQARDAAAALAAAAMLEDWMAQNPPFFGVNWLSGIELALRLVSAAFVVTALDAAAPGHGHGRALRRFIAAHAYWLARFPSLHSSANNHLVAEGLGLSVAAALMPDLPRHYGRRGRTILEAASRTQFHADGTGVEQSPTYAAFTLEMLLFGQLIAQGQAQAPTPETLTALGRAAAHLKALLDTGGRAPRIGDDDEGRVIVTAPEREELYVASIVAAAAGLLRRPELAPPVMPVQLRDLLFVPPALPAPPQSGLLTFPQGGYTVVREAVHGRNMLLVLDHGPLGFAPLAAHGHADALAVWLHLDDQPVFVDAGTYRYNANGGWRAWLRSSLAHNTLSINAESQSLPAGDFNWRHKAKTELVSLATGASWHVAARHDGYRARFGVLHQRACRRVNGGFLIEDALVAPDRHGDKKGTAAQLFRHHAQIGFLIHPALTVMPCRHGAILSKNGEALLRLVSRSGVAADIVVQDHADCPPIYSPAYNCAEPVRRIEFRPLRFDEPHLVYVEIIARRSRRAAWP